jgi:glycosyltransferase involved in cell wall biosynthesis
MKILMVLENKFPFDERVEKEALFLINSGYQVHLACMTRSGQPEHENYKQIALHRLKASKLFYKSSAACLLIPTYFLKWRKFIKKLCIEFRIDVIHVHDLPLTKPASQVAMLLKLYLVCDQHEFYSDWIVRTSHYNRTIIGLAIKYLSNWKEYEKKYLVKANMVITVEEPLRRLYIENVGIMPDKIIALPNTPLKSVFKEQPLMTGILEKYASSFTLLYIGGMDILRGLDNVILSLPLLKDKIKNLKLLLIGPRAKGYNPVQKGINMGLGDYIEYIPFQSIEKIPSYIAASKICFFTPHSEAEEINRTIATKIYQYAVMGKPVIVGRARMMKDFVLDNSIGISVNENDPGQFAEAVLRLYNDKQLYNNLSVNAKRVSKDYFWENTSEALNRVYNLLK